jgi:hypothetical protein
MTGTRPSAPRSTMTRFAAVAAAAALLVALPAGDAFAQRETHKLDDVVLSLSGGTSPEQLLRRYQNGNDCISFIVDQPAEQRLMRAGATAAFVTALKGRCYLGTELAVFTQPAGAEVLLDGRVVGRSPQLVRLAGGRRVTVGVKKGAWVRGDTVTITPDMRTRVEFAVPEDTLPHPRGRTVVEFGQQFGLLESFQSKLPKPELPPEPRGWSKLKRLTIGAALFGGAAYAAGATMCKVIDPAYVIDSVTYPAAELGVDPNCSGAYAAGGAVVGTLVTAGWSKMRHGARVRGFERAKRDYSKTVQQWEDDKVAERNRWLEAHPRVSGALAEQQMRLAPALDSVRRQNAEILLANRSISEKPTVMRGPPSIQEDVIGGGPTFLADVDSAIPRARAVNPNAIAVVIGNRSYRKADMPTVEYAARDAEVMKRYLIEALGFKAENIIHETDATLGALTQIFGTDDNEKGQLFREVTMKGLRGDSSDVFVFYSGHGAPGLNTKQAYLVPSDADPNGVELQGYPLLRLYRNLAKLPARSITVVLDACFSGGSERGPIVTGYSGGLLRLDNPFLAVENGTLFAAAEENQVSSWYEEKKHGLFTYYFLKGLQGAADADGNQEITSKELDEYLLGSVPSTARALRSREQRPYFVGRDPQRVVASLQEATVKAGER